MSERWSVGIYVTAAEANLINICLSGDETQTRELEEKHVDKERLKEPKKKRGRKGFLDATVLD